MRIRWAGLTAAFFAMSQPAHAQVRPLGLGGFVETCKSLGQTSITADIDTMLLFASCSGYFEGVVSELSDRLPVTCPTSLSLADQKAVYSQAVQRWQDYQKRLAASDTDTPPVPTSPARNIRAYIEARSQCQG